MATAAHIIRFLEKLDPEQEVTMDVWDEHLVGNYGQVGGYKKIPIKSFHTEERVPQNEVGDITGPAYVTSASLSEGYC